MLKQLDAIFVEFAQMAFQTVLISEDGVKVSEAKLFDRK